MNKNKWLFLCGVFFVLVSAVFIAYSNVYSNSFLYDDEFLIQKNQLIRSWDAFFKIFQTSSEGGAGGVSSFYRPLQTITYLLVYQLFGLSTFGFHLLNVTLHALNVCMVFLVLKRLRVSDLVSFSTSLIWGLLPLHVEAVTYQSATADPLHTFFILSGLFILLKSQISDESYLSQVINLALSSLMFLLALLSKESAIVFPALAVICIFCVSDKERWKFRSYLKTLPFWIIAVFYFIARFTILNFNQTFHFYKTANIYTENILYRIFTFFATLPNYLKLMAFPFDLHMDREFSVYTTLTEPVVCLGAVILASVIIFMIWSRGQHQKILFVGLAWFFAAYFPSTGILLPVNSFFLEHWLYLPCIGLFCGMLSLFQKHKRSLILFTVGVSVYYGLRTYQQNTIWENPISFYGNILKYNPNAERALNNIAMAYTDLHDYQKAIGFYNRAISVSDSYAQTRHNLGLALLNIGNISEAIKNFERAITINPDFYYSYELLYQIYQRSGDQEKAADYLKKYDMTVKKFLLYQ
ncbi:MAG: tetratricopeptide repeat protein [Pseudobdellovibrionaceae bacterium]